MKIKTILTVLAVLLVITSPYLFCEEIDYPKLFQTIKNSLSPIDVENEKAQVIEDSQEFASIFENGFNSFNVLAPYTQMKEDLKSVIKALANFKFTLRSATSTDIYQNAAPATVLVFSPEVGIGSGFVVNRQGGLAVTNFHVTSGLKNVLVAFYDKNIQDPSKLKFYSASVIRYSAKKDIAVLKIISPPKYINTLSFESAKRMNVGGGVHTIGHPLSLIWTYSHGLITAIRNKFRFGEEEIADVIQIDASISPGNSGGPLLNDLGNVVGMVTFSSSSQYAQNLNFAISSKEIESVLSSRKNEDTSASKALKKLYGMQLFSYSDVLMECNQYGVDEDGDGYYDYISLINTKTKKEAFRYVQGFEYEIEQGQKQAINILFMDITEDGIMDVLFLDFDLDDNFDSIVADIDGDEQPDIMGVDAEGKGQITKAWIL